ncbi:hypothetical protein IOLA_214 [uncultured bacterium]|nr:hypothetical protein IOLA_214 [uncultured bacterium]
MGKISSIFNGMLIATSVFLIYVVEKNISVLAEQSHNIAIMSEEIRMYRNYNEYNKVISNSITTSFCNIKDIINNPLQFILFFIKKNNAINVLDDMSIKNMIKFVSHCSSKNIKNKLLITENKILNLFKNQNQNNELAVEMFISIVNRYNFDIFLYPNKLKKLIDDWYRINKFTLDKCNIKEEDINQIIKFIMIYKLSEFLHI